MTAKRLFVVDAMAMAFRNFHAFGANQLTTSGGQPTSAVYGSAVFLIKLIQEAKPDYLVIATDSKEKTFRHDLYPQYKANRKDMPQELAVQIPYLYRLFDALGLKTLKEPGLEADDLIGSLVKQHQKEGMECFIVSGDKDFMQLVNHHIRLYSPKKGGEVQIIGSDQVREKFGVSPHQVIDILALIGDSSDNVPGVPGIGEKGAASLIQTFHSLDGIYDNLDKITNKRQHTALKENRDLAYLCQKLVTIKTDATIHHDLHEFECHPDNNLRSRALLQLMHEMEFRSLAQKVEGWIAESAMTSSATAEKPADSPSSKAGHYRLVNTRDAFQLLLNELQTSPCFAFDTETTGLDIVNDRPIGFAITPEAGQGYYLPLLPQHLPHDLTAEEIKDGMRPLLEHPQKIKVGHNIKFDLQMLWNCGLTMKGPMADTMLASYLLDSTARSHGLDHCCLTYLDFVKTPTTALIGNDKAKAMAEVPLPALTAYAGEDADFTLRLYEHFMPRLKQQDLTKVFHEIEMPLVPVLARMERNGIFVDAEILAEFSHTLDQRTQQLEREIFDLAGEEFNIKSTKQLQTILYEKLKVHEQLNLKRVKKTKSGLSTDVSVLETMTEHPIARALLEYRTVTKLKSTYVDTLPQLINPGSGRLHTHFHQTGTATGRLSSSDPNLQNIPIRTEMGREIRKAFRAERPGYAIVSADYSQVELRILAEVSRDANLIQAFQGGQDIHAATAARIFGRSILEVPSEERAQAKAINFGIIYGMGPQRLARQTGVKTAEAKEFIERYFATYPGIKTYIDQSIRFAKDHGYTVTMTGRRRPLPEIHSKDNMVLANAQNIAVNSPIQGSAADLIKLAMIKIQNKLEESGWDAKMLLQVHDELVFECREADVSNVEHLVKSAMEHAMNISVPLTVEIGHGHNWLEAH